MFSEDEKLSMTKTYPDAIISKLRKRVSTILKTVRYSADDEEAEQLLDRAEVAINRVKNKLF